MSFKTLAISRYTLNSKALEPKKLIIQLRSCSTENKNIRRGPVHEGKVAAVVTGNPFQ